MSAIERILKVRSLSKDDLSTNIMHDPFLLKDLEKAIYILYDAIKQNKKILIWGDYDADGIMSTIVLYLFLKNFGADVSYHIPLREHGYGISVEGVQSFVGLYDVFLTCDNGITAVEVGDFLQSKNKTFIITDHHQAQEILPKADAIVNPNQPECSYPFKQISGCFVAWKLAYAFEKTFYQTDVFAMSLLQFVAISTISDVMPLKDENRTAVKIGLKQLQETKNPGLKSLLKVLNLNNKELNSYHVAFYIAPCLNSTGRLVSALDAVDMCVHPYTFKAYLHAKNMKKLNEERKKMCEEWFYALHSEINDTDSFLLLYHPNIPEGIVGIIAGQFKEKYRKPTIVLTNSNEMGLAKGSGRSIETVSLFELLSKYKYLLHTFGGHHQACGLSIHVQKINQLKHYLLKEKIEPEKQVLKVDTLLMPNEINLEFVEKDLKMLEPYGVGNPEPVFGFLQSKIKLAKPIGKEQNHLQLTIAIGDKEFRCIGWNQWQKYCDMNFPQWVDIAFQPEINEWNGNKNIQLKIKDFKPCSDYLLA
ncbi:MAG: single-stranded-DNA-specific exonuclease RecJ [Ignavibacterium sp.]|nr:single-stranded-DNA-specific exonuclease RecJ [Ignavibacterium sp.]